MKIFLRRVYCLFCDLTLAYLFMYFFLYIKPSQIPIFSSYFLILTFYYFITFLIFKRSLFQFLFRFEIQKNQWCYILIKLTLIAIIPFFLTFFHKTFWTIRYELLLIIILIIIALIIRKSLWQFLSRSIVAIEDIIAFRKLKKYLILCITGLVLISLLDVGFTVFQKANDELSERNLLSFLSSEKWALPVSCFLKKKYVNDINRAKQNPIEYIFNLFEENDIVIISERMHPEYTQWQLLSQIILNNTFAAKIGNICTEYGRINNQQNLEDYLSTTFGNEEERKKATAHLVRENGWLWPIWTNKNFYDFVLNLHQFNSQKDSSQKINLFFSDAAANWDTITSHYKWEKTFYGVDRDSIMAVNIISKYKEFVNKNAERKKILVIENTRHAYKGYGSTASYIFKEFPDKTTNVHINYVSVIHTPSKAGLWDAAALQVKDTMWAINFNESQLGNDHFDLFPNITRKRYKDVFDGMIYYKHPKDFRIVEGYDFMLDDFKDTLLKREILSGNDSLQVLKFIEYYEEKKIIDREAPPFKLFNLAFACLHFIILIFLLINLVVQYVRIENKKIVPTINA